MHEQIDIGSGHETAMARPSFILKEFCRAVGSVIDTSPVHEAPRRVADLLPDLLAVSNFLSDEQRTAPADGYGRNRVFLCPRDNFSIFAMAWPAGVSTPIHDHRDWCALGVYEGEIEETHYQPSDLSPDCTTAFPRKVLRHRPGAVAHLPVAAPNIHKIHNPTPNVAISIHVYGGNCETLGPNLDRIYTVEP